MPVKIVYYKSVLCPRCIPTNKMLKAFQQRYPEVEIEEVEALRFPRRMREAGIRHLPTLVIGEQILTRAIPIERLTEMVFKSTPNTTGRE